MKLTIIFLVVCLIFLAGNVNMMSTKDEYQLLGQKESLKFNFMVKRQQKLQSSQKKANQLANQDKAYFYRKKLPIIRKG